MQEQPWIDSLGICWEGIEDIDRYGFEYEEFQEMRRLAIEIACDNRFNQSVPKEELNTVGTFIGHLHPACRPIFLPLYGNVNCVLMLVIGFSEDDVKDEK